MAAPTAYYAPTPVGTPYPQGYPYAQPFPPQAYQGQLYSPQPYPAGYPYPAQAPMAPPQIAARSVGFQQGCQCGSKTAPIDHKRIGFRGLFPAIVLSSVGLSLFAWIPLVIPSLKDQFKKCPDCGALLQKTK